MGSYLIPCWDSKLGGIAAARRMAGHSEPWVVARPPVQRGGCANRNPTAWCENLLEWAWLSQTAEVVYFS